MADIVMTINLTVDGLGTVTLSVDAARALYNQLSGIFGGTPAPVYPWGWPSNPVPKIGDVPWAPTWYTTAVTNVSNSGL